MATSGLVAILVSLPRARRERKKRNSIKSPSKKKNEQQERFEHPLTSHLPPGGDLFASPGDPYFFLHHAQIDRTWWIWQNQDLQTRQNAIAGTNTLFNFPPSANTTLDDLIDIGVNAPAIKIKEAMSTLGEQFCYTYA